MACSAPEPEPAPPAAWQPPAQEDVAIPALVATATGEAVDVTLAFSGVGALHRGYFGTPEHVGRLGTGLGACLRAPGRVVVSWDEEERIGRIVLDTAPEALSPACVPKMTPEGLDMSPVAPIGTSLAAYRDAIGGHFDLRVSSFRIGVSLFKGPHLCTLWAAGQFPPDGTTWSGCVGMGGVEQCAIDDRRAPLTVLPFDGEDRRYLASCTRP